MERILQFLFWAICFCTSIITSAQDIQIPVEVEQVSRSDGYHVLREEYNPNLDTETEGEASFMISSKRLSFPSFDFPSVSMVYTSPEIIRKGENRISAFLKSKRAPRVIIRVPEKIQDAKFIEDIELQLGDLGWTILEHNLIFGLKSVKDIKSKTGADLILDISWLKFSDPSMFTDLDLSNTSIGDFYGDSHIGGYYNFKSEKDFEKWKKDRNPKHFYNKNVPLVAKVVKANFSSYRESFLNQMLNYDRFNTNKNVISAIFKFIAADDGSVLGYYHIGECNSIKLQGGAYIFHNGQVYKKGNHKKADFYLEDLSDFYIEMKNEIKDKVILNFLSYMDVFLPNGEIPYAAQLNEMEDVKLSDELINESYQSSSTTNSSYSGRSRDYHNAYFNSRYYSGSGRGNYSGSSSSTTKSSGSATTIFKDAEYIKYSDFFGYYTPLTEKFVKEIQTLLK